MSKSPMTIRLLTQWLVAKFAIPCGLCSQELEPEDGIQWDHIHAEVFSGPHVYDNLRPVHVECHKKKTKADVQANAKIKRILGLTKNKPKKKIPTRKFNA